MLAPFVSALSMLACTTPPVFSDIREVGVLETKEEVGLSSTMLEGEHLELAKTCLYAAQEITLEELNNEGALQELIVLLVKDRAGDRMLELTTNENFVTPGAGTSKKYFKSDCILKVLKEPPKPVENERIRRRPTPSDG